MENLLSIELPDGRVIARATEAEALAAGATPAAVALAQLSALAVALRQATRAKIARDAGDSLTLIGTNADGVALMFVEMATMAKALTEATSVAEVNAAAAPFELLTRDFLAGVQGGTIKLPYLVKSDRAATLTEIQTRAHVAAEAFEAE